MNYKYYGVTDPRPGNLLTTYAKTHLRSLLTTPLKLLVSTRVSPNTHPEDDTTDPLDDKEQRTYQRFIGILEWIKVLGRADITFATASLSRFNSAPRRGHLERVYHIFGYLQARPKVSVRIDPALWEEGPKYDELLSVNMRRQYPDAVEELSINQPVIMPKSRTLDVVVYADSNYGHDNVTKRSMTGIVAMVGSTPVMAKSKRQTAVETSTFSAEFSAARTAVETATGIRFLLRSLGVPIFGPSQIYGDNEAAIFNASRYASALKKRHTSISYN